VAGVDGSGLLNSEFAVPSRSSRYDAVSRVLFRVLILNVAVAAAKIAFGYAIGAISVLLSC